MALRLVQMNIKARDDEALGRFWAGLLGWDLSSEAPGVANVEPPEAAALGIDIVAVPDPRSVDYRTHLELAFSADLLDRLALLDATRIGPGRAGTDWADPEGNRFTVVDAPAASGPISSVVVECADPGALAPFWASAIDTTVQDATDDLVRLHSSTGVGPSLEFRREAHPLPTRMHLDLRPYPGADQAAEVARLRGLGATETDIGQGAVPWNVLTDPAGNEFCVLTAG